MLSKIWTLKSCAGIGAAVALATALTCGNANAATAIFSLVGGSSYILPTGSGINGFDPGGWNSTSNSGIDGGTSVTAFISFLSGQGLFVSDGSSTTPLNLSLRFTYLGFEAGYTNVAETAFVYGDDALFVNYGTTIGSNTTSPRPSTRP
jgi:hypothetical protein